MSALVHHAVPGYAALTARRYLRPTAISQLSFNPLTFSGHDSEPSASADGKTLYFEGVGLGIWMLNHVSGSFGLIVSSGGRDTEPFLNADGSRLFWTSRCDGHFEVYSGNSDGSLPK